MNQKAFTFLIFILILSIQCSCQTTDPSSTTTSETESVKKIETTPVAKTPAQLRAERLRDYSFLEMDGKKIHYRSEGEGPVMILIHGMGSNLTQWNHYTDYFKTKFQVVSVDLPGGRFGKSESLYKMNHTDNLSLFISDFMNSLNIDKAHIIGSSYGGSTAYNFAANHSEKVDKLILIAPAIRLNDPLVEKINNPTLLIWGEKDPILPLEQAHFLNDNIKDSKLTIYEGGPHVPIDAPYAKRSIQDIEQFLKANK